MPVRAPGLSSGSSGGAVPAVSMEIGGGWETEAVGWCESAW